ncbi:MAG TPA: helix-turn-helix domain-containing protein [Tepidisphaeraceae bacterium]|jgi:chromosomal replication initiator protein|nr:helix-turn-helix domain-containing protein [Tepidisphaeraceae bacterium]
MIPTLDNICAKTAAFFNVEAADLRGRRKLQHFTEPREVAYLLMHRFGRRTWGQIGLYMNRDHATCLHGARRMEQLMQTDPTLRQQVEILDRELRLEAERQAAQPRAVGRRPVCGPAPGGPVPA